MEPGDLFRVRNTYGGLMPEVHTLNRKGQFIFAFYLHHSDVGVIINPNDWGGYEKALLRGQVVWLYFHRTALEVIR